jgi:uncharacterized repeat protein (TIGR01451 family)
MVANDLLNLRDTLEKKFTDQWEGDLAATYMAATYQLLKKKDAAEKLLKVHLTRDDPAAKRGDGWWGYQFTPVAREATDFALICRHFPKRASNFGYDDLAPILEPMQKGRINTIGSAMTILAFKSYSSLVKDHGVKTGILALPREGGDPQILAPMASGYQHTSFLPGTRTLRFTREKGEGDLGAFYQVVEEGYDRGLPTEVIRDGLEVLREITDTEGKSVSTVRVGDGLAVRLVVRNIGPRDLSNIAVLDLLPGGFEVEANALRPGRGTVPGAEFVEVREDRNVFFCSVKRGETKTFRYRIKPTVAGVFAIPPAFAEDMYDPAIKARAGAGKITVTPAE